MEQLKQNLDAAMKDFNKNDVKAVAIDIDGTLINTETICSEYTVEVIQKLIKTGREVYIVTGRVVGTAKKYAEQVGIPKYMINGNGAVIWNMQTNSIDFEDPIKKETTKNLISICREKDVFVSLYILDTYFYECDENPYLSQYKSHTSIQGHKQDLMTVDMDRVQKFFIMGPEEVIINLHDEIKTKFNDDVTVLITTPRLHNLANPDFPARCLEIMGSNVNKGNTLKKLLESQNISMDEVVTFGDDVNDIEMLKNAKWGVAMNNARPSVKEAAKLETLSNDDDGVAYFIEKYIL